MQVGRNSTDAWACCDGSSSACAPHVESEFSRKPRAHLFCRQRNCVSQTGVLIFSRHRSSRTLSFVDFVSLVVGAIIGADIYVVAGIGAPLMGPALLVVWVLAGLVAMLIALCFAQCAAIEPLSGGPYAYARSALGGGPAVVVGWALYLAEWSALAAFPVAIAKYLVDALGLGPVEVALLKVAFVAFFTLSNLIGIRRAAIVDDLLTAAKLIPLAALVGATALLVARQPTVVAERLVPFAPLGWGSIASAFVVVFWAYAGFEVGSLPAAAVTDPRSVMPRGLILGMLISIAFYLLTNLAVFLAVPWQQIGSSQAPLSLAMASTLSALGLSAMLGARLMTAGAFISISGTDQATTLGSAELAGAMAVDDVLPSILAHRSARFGTRDYALVVQGTTTLLASLLFSLVYLIQIAVFFLALVYAATALSSRILLARHADCTLRIPGMWIIPILAVVASVAIGTQVPPTQVALGCALLASGVLATGADRLRRGQPR